MFYLLLAVMSSALVSIIMRFSEKHVHNNMAMFMCNYAVCAVLALFYTGGIDLIPSNEGIYMAMILGFLSGILFLVNFALLQKTMDVSGLILASTAMKLGSVLIPALVAISFFHEKPGILQILGIVFAIFAIILINIEKGSIDKKGSKFWVIILLLVSGLTDTTVNIYDKTGNPYLKDYFLFYIFAAALILSLIVTVKNKKKVTVKDVVFGILIAIPNYFSSRFLLLALGSVPAVVVYPFYSVGTIVAVTCFSLLAFRERISNQKKAALILIMVALTLLNL